MGLFSSIGSIIGGFIGGGSAKKATKEAAQLQYQAAQDSIAETARQYDQSRSDFQPFRDAGVSAVGQLGNLVGVNGAEEQQSAIDALRNSPLYQSLYRGGEEAVLANASATGGIRGGNTQRSLYELGEDTLSRTIQNQIANYGGLVGIGTGATNATAALGANATAQSNFARNQGANAQAQGVLTRGGIDAQNWSNIGTGLGAGLSKILGGF